MRLRPILPLVVAALALGAARAPTTVRYEIDPSHTTMGFKVKHMLVTNVHGTFNTFSGHVVLDTADVTRSTAEVVIDVASIDTNAERRDNHLRSPDFFDVQRFPRLTFTGKRVEKEGGQLFLAGDLAIRDVTRPVRIPFELAGPVDTGRGGKRIGIEGTLTIDRHDYGLTWNNLTEGVQVVGDEVEIELNVEARAAG